MKLTSFDSTHSTVRRGVLDGQPERLDWTPGGAVVTGMYRGSREQ